MATSAASVTTTDSSSSAVETPPDGTDYEAVARKVKAFGRGTLQVSETMSAWQLARVSFGAVRRLAAALGGWINLVKTANRSRTLRNEREREAINALQQLGVASEAHCKALLEMPFMLVAAAQVLGSEERAHQAFMTAVCGASAADAGLDVDEVKRALPQGASPAFALRVYSAIMRSINACDVRDGVRHVTDIEDTPTSAGFDVTFCAYAEAFRIVGIPTACAIVCAGDEMFIPPAIEPLGLHFERTGTIGNGQSRCDFRFVVGPKQQPTTTSTASTAAATVDTAPTAINEIAPQAVAIAEEEKAPSP